MILPNAERAVVDIAKLRDYCLDTEHEEGKHKARVFQAALGFTQRDAEQLRAIILSGVLTDEATSRSPNSFGQRFVVDFAVDGLQGKVTLRSAWIIRNDEDFPRLTSCYVL